jgi:Sec-independent protein translocase protein TatA
VDTAHAKGYDDSMFGFGLGHLILVGAIALIAIGPKQLPEVARTVGRLLNEFRRLTDELKSQMMDTKNTSQQFLNDTRKSIYEPTPYVSPQAPLVDPAVSEDANQLSFDAQVPFDHPHLEPHPQFHARTVEEEQMAFNLSATEPVIGLPAQPLPNQHAIDSPSATSLKITPADASSRNES